jgi:hypothetical protein
MSSDDEKYGGWNQVQHIKYPVKTFNGEHFIELYLPARTAIVLKEGKIKKTPGRKPAAKKVTAK